MIASVSPRCSGPRLIAVTLFVGFSAAAQDAASPDAAAPPAAAPPPVAEPVAGPAADASAASTADDAALDLFMLDSQLQQEVVSSTKTQQRSAQTPAVVTVVGRDEIAARGYTSLAEILRAIPGFYDVYDLVAHNIGIRGINGGARASGNVLKLMIDGHPVDYRPSTGNFFGEELVPIHAIERVEIIRGPASAVYGANAFLGVVNLITRSGKDIGGLQVAPVALLQRTNPGGGGLLTAGAASEGIDVLLSASGFNLDRSGLHLPASSPLAQGSSAISDRGPSRADLARPRSFFGKVTLGQIAGGDVSLSSSVQNLDAAGEFLEFGPLSHGSRISVLNENYRARWSGGGEKLSVDVSGHYFRGSPNSTERFDIGRSDYALLRRGGADGFGFSADARFPITDTLSAVVGGDFVQELHRLQSYDRLTLEPVLASDGTVIRPVGTILPGEGAGARSVFRNIGGLAQLLWTLTDSFSAVAGARADYHNIYGLYPSARAGVVFAPPDRPLSLKLLYGSSFKAPSAEQLYTAPLKVLDVQGNPQLRPQTAHTFELAGGYGFADVAEVSVNLFATNVLGRVEFVQRGLYLQAQNVLDEWVLGGELDARWSATRSLQLRMTAGAARTVARAAGSSLLGLPEVQNALFPPVQIHLLADYLLPLATGARVSVEASYITARPSSQSNALEAGQPYAVDPYLFTAASFSIGTHRFFGTRETSATLRIANALDARWAEPGFGGIDVPAPGISATLMIVQQL